jgi:hypothetical protein
MAALPPDAAYQARIFAAALEAKGAAEAGIAVLENALRALERARDAANAAAPEDKEPWDALNVAIDVAKKALAKYKELEVTRATATDTALTAANARRRGGRRKSRRSKRSKRSHRKTKRRH